MIFRQHHHHFKNEDKQQTTFIMRDSTMKLESTLTSHKEICQRLTGYKWNLDSRPSNYSEGSTLHTPTETP